MAQRQRRLHEERPARGIATPVLAKTQQAGEQQQQRQHEANHSDDDVEAAPKIAQPHRTAHDAQEADEGAQLHGCESRKGGGKNKLLLCSVVVAD